MGNKVLSQHLQDLQPKGMNTMDEKKGVGLLSGPL